MKLPTEFLRLSVFVLYVLIILSLLLSLVHKEEGIGMIKSITPISITGTASIDHGPEKEITESLWNNTIQHSLIVRGNFNHPITDGNSLILWPRNLRVKLYVNEIEKLSTGQRESFPNFIQYAGNSYQLFYIGNVSTKDHIRIEIEKAYESCRINVITNFFQNIYVGRDAAVYQSILSNEMLHPIIGLILTLVGVLILFASVLQEFTQFGHMRRIYYLAWFCIVGGISYTSDSCYEFIDLLFPHPVFNTLIDLCNIPLLLLLYLMFITSVLESTKVKKFMKWVTRIYVVIGLIPFILQASGIRDLHVLQDQYVFTGGILLILSYGATLCEILYGKTKRIKKALYIIIPFSLSLFFKILNIILEQGVERSFLRIGILASCVLLLHSTFQYAKRSMQLIEEQQQIAEELQNSQIAIMLSQIQPHFLYNALNALQHICKKDGLLAAEAIEHFSKYLRGNMDSLTNNHPIPFEQELEHVKHYLYIEQLRFGDRVRIEYDLTTTQFYIPTLTLQPIVENAIRHGITKKMGGGVVKISTKAIQDTIQIIVEDNGVGFHLEDHPLNQTSHIGLSNVKKRVQLQCNGTVDINSTIGIGTKVTIYMKGTGMPNNEGHGC